MTIDLEEINALAEETAEPSRERLEDILEEAGRGRGLSLSEAAELLNLRDPLSLKALSLKAREVKERIYGGRIVLFAPLYLSNHCTNSCAYCGFNATNTGMERTALTPEEAAREAASLVRMGFKRVLLVTGEHPAYGLDYINACIRAVYDKSDMRIVHLNAPPMDTESLRVLKRAGVGVYQSFQETYHRPTYSKVHIAGPKSDFDFRLAVMDRAMEAGFGDVGIGPLLGLYDHRFECLAAIAHSMHLYTGFGAHAHTVSVPRLRPASNAAAAESPPSPLTDVELEKVVAVLRLSLPTAGIVVTTRETPELRERLMRAGASQISAASSTTPGGYTHTEQDSLEQFSTSDHRSLDEVLAAVAREGHIPSLCTTCYRVGRVGGEFTEKTSSGGMQRLCQANALLTLKEYLLDAEPNGSRVIIAERIRSELASMKESGMKDSLIRKLARIEAGERDLFF